MENAFTGKNRMRKAVSARVCRWANVVIVIALVGMVFAHAALADTNIAESVKLTVDTDWRSLGNVTIPDGVGVHLNGHSLHVSSFDGAGSIYASAIPPDYVELDYIETDGTQYIDTGVTPYLTVKVDADIAFIGPSASTYAPLISASVNDDSYTLNAKVYGVWLWNGKWAMFYSGNRYESSASASVSNRTHLVAAWGDSARTLHINGVEDRNVVGSLGAQNTTHTMYLPGWNSGQMRNLTVAKFRIYSLKIYKSWDTLLRDYVPVKRTSDGAVGLYDIRNSTFSPSATEKPFIAGKEISTPGGELHIDVAGGTTFQNSTVAISNGVKVVKEGAGTYVSGKGQAYFGGTLVSAGRVKISGITSASDVLNGFGAVGSDVVVASNAQVVIDGFFQTLSGYNVTIAGGGPDGNGAIYGNKKRVVGTYNSPFLRSLALSGDASIKVIAEDSFNLCAGSGATLGISLRGHRLTATGSARFVVLGANVTDAGGIVSSIAPGSNPTQNNFYIPLGMSAPLVDFKVAQGGAIGGDFVNAVVVSNMTFAGRWAANQIKSVTVLDCYSPLPTAVNWPKLTLGDSEHLSPTLDLSDISSTYDGTAMSFAEGATIAVKLGDRKLSSHMPLVSWTAAPANRFVLGDSVATGNLEKMSDGLYFVRRGFVIVVQ